MEQRASGLCAGQLPLKDIKCTSSLSPGSNQRKWVLLIIPTDQRNQAQGIGDTCSLVARLKAESMMSQLHHQSCEITRCLSLPENRAMKRIHRSR